MQLQRISDNKTRVKLCNRREAYYIAKLVSKSINPCKTTSRFTYFILEKNFEDSRELLGIIVA